MNKKFICLLLAVCLCAGMLPMLVLGLQETSSTGNVSFECTIDNDGNVVLSASMTSESTGNYCEPKWKLADINDKNKFSGVLINGAGWFVDGNNNYISEVVIPYKSDIVGVKIECDYYAWHNSSSESGMIGFEIPERHTIKIMKNDNEVEEELYFEHGETIGVRMAGWRPSVIPQGYIYKLDAKGGPEYKADLAVVSDLCYYITWVPNSGGVPGAMANGMGLAGPYIYDEDEDIMMTPAEAGHIHEYGDAAYYLLIDEVSVRKDDMAGMSGAPVGPMSDMDHVEKLKVKAKGWTNGGEIVEGVEVAKCKVDIEKLFQRVEDRPEPYECAKILNSYQLGSGYYYFLKIDLGEKESTAETDVIGVVEFNRKANSKKGIGKIDESTHDIDFSVFYEYGWLTKWPTITDDRVDFEWDTTYALKFDNDDEVELSFGTPNGGNNEGTFEVDTSGQGKVLLRYTTDADEAIAAANEGADIDFLIFNNVKFNRTGTFTYEMENGAYAYRIVDGKLVEMPDCYDEKEEAFVFNTHILGAYVFADRALVNPA